MEQSSVDDSFDANECGGNEFDDSGFIVWSIYISGTDWLGKSVVEYSVLLDEAPVKAIDWSSAIDEGFGDDVFVESLTDRAIQNDFDCLSPTITLLMFSGVESSFLKILYIEFSDEFFFIAYFFSLLYL